MVKTYFFSFTWKDYNKEMEIECQYFNEKKKFIFSDNVLLKIL